MSAAVVTNKEPSLSLADRLSDRINPIAIKDLRQAVNSRFLTGMLLALLGLMLALLVSHSTAALAPAGGTEGHGPRLFLQIQMVFLIAAGVGVPVYTAVRLGLERASISGDLLHLTLLSAGQVALGKLAGGVVVACVIASACAPFLAISWLLRGIDVVEILAGAAASGAAVVCLIAAGVLVGAAGRFAQKLLFLMLILLKLPLVLAAFTLLYLLAGGGPGGLALAAVASALPTTAILVLLSAEVLKLRMRSSRFGPSYAWVGGAWKGAMP